MTAPSFVDPNVVLYTLGKDPQKSRLARALTGDRPAVSVQVVNDCVSGCVKMPSFSREQAYAFARTLMDRTHVLPLDETALDRAATLALRYRLAHWDALIAASGLLAGCDTLHSVSAGQPGKGPQEVRFTRISA